MNTVNQTIDVMNDVDVELGMMNQAEENPMMAPVMAAPAKMSGLQVASTIDRLIFSQDNRANVAAAMLLSAVNTAANFLAPLELGGIVQRFPDPNYSKEDFFQQLCLLIGAYLSSQLMSQLIVILLAQPTVNTSQKLLMECMDHQLKKSLNFYLREPTSEHTNVIQKGFMVGGIGLPALMQLTPTLIQLALADLYFFLKYGTQMGCSIIVLVSVSLLYNLMTSPQVMAANAVALQTGNQVNESMFEIIKCYKTMRDFCHYDYTIKQFNHKVSQWAPTFHHSLLLPAKTMIGQVLMVYAHMLWVAWYVGSRVQSGQYSTQDFIVAIGYLQLLSAILPAFSQSFLMSFAMLYPNASFIFNALNEADEVVDLHPDTPFPAIPGQAPSIELDQMSFDYPPRPNERTPKVGFHQLSCQINPGERVAIVTESGVGKSTLFNLLFGYYVPTAGHIKING